MLPMYFGKAIILAILALIASLLDWSKSVGNSLVTGCYVQKTAGSSDHANNSSASAIAKAIDKERMQSSFRANQFKSENTNIKVSDGNIILPFKGTRLHELNFPSSGKNSTPRNKISMKDHKERQSTTPASVKKVNVKFVDDNLYLSSNASNSVKLRSSPIGNIAIRYKSQQNTPLKKKQPVKTAKQSLSSQPKASHPPSRYIDSSDNMKDQSKYHGSNQYQSRKVPDNFPTKTGITKKRLVRNSDRRKAIDFE